MRLGDNGAKMRGSRWAKQDAATLGRQGQWGQIIRPVYIDTHVHIFTADLWQPDPDGGEFQTVGRPYKDPNSRGSNRTRMMSSRMWEHSQPAITSGSMLVDQEWNFEVVRKKANATGEGARVLRLEGGGAADFERLARE